jgi:hypothetical protein
MTVGVRLRVDAEMNDNTNNIELSKADARKLLNEKVQAAYAAIADAQVIADKHGLNFDFDIAYGMGGSYIGDPEEREEYDEDELDGGWRSSSAMC